MTSQPSRRRTRALWLVAVLALAGCQLRLETPPPSEPSPDAAEQVRARAVDQAVTLGDAARSAGEGAVDAVAAVLGDVTAFSAEHADALGGVYRSGLPTPSPTALPAPPPAATPDDVLAELRSSSTQSLTDADAVADGATARLLAEVGTARGELAARLAAALGEPVPPPPGDAGTTSPATSAAVDATTTATPPADAATGGAPSPSATPDGSEGAGAAATGGLPTGMTAEAAAALVLAHDQAGYAYEVLAAKSADAERAADLAAAAAHRGLATSWAERAALAAGASDPRRAAYALPDGLDDAAARAELAAELESAVAEAAAAAIPGVAAGSRGELVSALGVATAAARALGATPAAFPGSSDAPPVAAPAPAGDATGGPPRWPPLEGAGPLPTHLPQDTGPRSGASGTATADPDGSFTYVVASGDVLGAIGLRFFPDDSMTASAALLRGVNPDTIAGEAIKDGDRIVVPNGRYTASG